MKAAISPFGNGSWGNCSVVPFNPLFKMGFNPLSHPNLSVKDADCLILWGGEDINPALYKQKPHPLNDTNSEQLSYRDVVEWEMLREARANDVPIIGVCRGAQLLCAFAGGKLAQHVTQHRQGHIIKTHDGLSIHAAASHHQMMIPDGTNHQLLAWGENLGTKYEGESSVFLTEGEYISKNIDPEVVYFSDLNAMAIQPHPEWHSNTKDEFPTWIVEQLNLYMFA